MGIIHMGLFSVIFKFCDHCRASWMLVEYPISPTQIHHTIPQFLQEYLVQFKFYPHLDKDGKNFVFFGSTFFTKFFNNTCGLVTGDETYFEINAGLPFPKNSPYIKLFQSRSNWIKETSIFKRSIASKSLELLNCLASHNDDQDIEIDIKTVISAFVPLGFGIVFSIAQVVAEKVHQISQNVKNKLQ